MPALIDAMFHATPSVQVEAATALGRIAADAEHAVPALTSAVAMDFPELVTAAAGSLVAFGPKAVGAEPKLMAALESAGHANDVPRTSNIIAALIATVPDAPAKIKAQFNGSDPELRRVVIGELLRQARKGITEPTIPSEGP